MKKKLLCSILVVMLVSLLCFGLSACRSDAAEPNQDNAAQPKANVEIVSQEVQKYQDSLGSVNAAYLAEIKNTGTSTVKLSDLSIDLNSTDGNLIGVTDYVSAFPSIIKPGESAYIMEEIYNSVFDTPVEINSIGEAVLHYNAEESKEAPILPIELTDAKLQTDAFGTPEIIGNIKNTGDTDLKYVYVVGIVRDSAKTLQNMIFTIIDSLPAGSDKGFSGILMPIITHLL
jgi:hypothetical protein